MGVRVHTRFSVTSAPIQMLLSWKSFIFQQVKLLVLPQHGFILSRLSWTIQTLRTFGPPRNDKTKNTPEQPQSSTACSGQAAAKLQTRSCPSFVHTCYIISHRTSVFHSNVKTSQFKHFGLLCFTVNKIPVYVSLFFFILTFLELGLCRPDTLHWL